MSPAILKILTMKSLFLILASVLSIIIGTGLLSGQQIQPVPTRNGTVYYEDVIASSGNISKQELFSKTKQWVASNYSSTLTYNPVQLEDAGNGIIIVNINLGKIQCTNCNYSYDNITCSLKLQFKDNKYKYTFSHFKAILNLTSGGTKYTTDSDFDDFFKKEKLYKGDLEILTELDNKVRKVIDSLIQTLKEPVVENF